MSSADYVHLKVIANARTIYALIGRELLLYALSALWMVENYYCMHYLHSDW